MKKNLLCAALMAALAPTVSAQPISAFALFGGNNTNIGSNVTVTSGLVGSNNIMSINGGSSLVGIMGSGALSGGPINVSGDVIFNGNVNLTGNAHTGNIHGGANVTLGNGAVVNGDIRAIGQVNLGGNSSVSGVVNSAKATGVAVDLGINASVTGAVTHISPSTIKLGSGASIGSDNTATAPVAPNAYASTVLAAATAISAGVGDIIKAGNQSTTLAAGDYNNLNLGFNNTLILGAGTYRFNKFTLGGSSHLTFNLGGGDIFLYFADNVSVGNSLDVTVIGGDASDIYAETLGNWSQDGSGEWFGTVYGSGATSNVHFGASSNLVGSFVARNRLDLDGGSTVALLGLDPVVNGTVPEPSSILLGGIGLLGLAAGRRRKASASRA